MARLGIESTITGAAYEYGVGGYVKLTTRDGDEVTIKTEDAAQVQRYKPGQSVMLVVFKVRDRGVEQ